MNKIAIIAGIGGLVVGATGGYFACHFIEQKKIDKAISDGIQSTLDEIRAGQKEKVMENDKKKNEMIKFTGREINHIPHFDAVDIAKDIAKDSGYVEESVEEPSEAPDDDSDLPFEVGESKEEKHNIWDEPEPDEDSLTQEEYDKTVEPEGIDFEKLDPKKKPYKISEDEYSNGLAREVEEGMWDKVSLILFTDNVFAERVRINEFTMMSSTEIELAIGKDNMKSFIEDRSLKRDFVRNNKLHIDYEIVRSTRSYSSAMREDDEE